MNFGVKLNSGNFLTGCKPVDVPRMTVLHGVSKELHIVLLQ